MAVTLKDDKYVGLDHELAVATERWNEVHSARFVAWQALVDGYAPKSSNDPSCGVATHTCDALEHVAGCGLEKASSVSIPHHPSWGRLVQREG